MLSKLFGFLKSLFGRARKGFEAWLKANLPGIKLIVRSYIEENADRKFYEYRDEVFLAVRRLIPSQIPDNWISLAISFALEHLKSEALKATK